MVQKKPVFLKLGFIGDKITGTIDFRLMVMLKWTYLEANLVFYTQIKCHSDRQMWTDTVS